jgi:hypothetical protein
MYYLRNTEYQVRSNTELALLSLFQITVLIVIISSFDLISSLTLTVTATHAGHGAIYLHFTLLAPL